MPCANLARMLAVAGATTRASVVCAASICSMAESRLSSGDSGGTHRLVMTLCPVIEAKVSGWMNCVAASVMTTWTSSACCCSARTSSAALYAAMPPETPTVTFILQYYGTHAGPGPKIRTWGPLATQMRSGLEADELRNLRGDDLRLEDRRIGFHVTDLAGGDLILCNFAGLAGTGINQR